MKIDHGQTTGLMAPLKTGQPAILVQLVELKKTLGPMSASTAAMIYD